MTERQHRQGWRQELAARPVTYVASDQDLQRCARALRRCDSIAVDCESNSMHAYREQLCLMQISCSSADYIIDPLAIRHPGPLLDLLADPGVEKVFHDCEYDLILIRKSLACRVRHVYDTKVAAVAVGCPAFGLAALLEAHFGVQLDKRLQRSNWGARPLSKEQIEYARCDTAFLIRLAAILEAAVERAGGIVPKEVLAECRRLEAMETEGRDFDPDDFGRISGARTLDPHARRVLRELFVLRDEEARARNLPPFKVLPNHALLELAKARPDDRKALRAVRALPESLANRHGRAILEVIRAASTMDPIHHIPTSRNGRLPSGLDDAGQGVYEQLRRWRKARAEQRPTDPSHILSRTTMGRIAAVRPSTLAELRAIGLLEPWRIAEYGAEILGAVQLGLAEGRVSRRRGR